MTTAEPQANQLTAPVLLHELAAAAAIEQLIADGLQQLAAQRAAEEAAARLRAEEATRQETAARAAYEDFIRGALPVALHSYLRVEYDDKPVERSTPTTSLRIPECRRIFIATHWEWDGQQSVRRFSVDRYRVPPTHIAEEDFATEDIILALAVARERHLRIETIYSQADEAYGEDQLRPDSDREIVGVLDERTSHSSRRLPVITVPPNRRARRKAAAKARKNNKRH